MKTFITLVAVTFACSSSASAQILRDNELGTQPTYVRAAPASPMHVSPAFRAPTIQRVAYYQANKQPTAWSSLRGQTPVQTTTYDAANVAPSLLSPTATAGASCCQATATPPRSVMQPISGPYCPTPANFAAVPTAYPQLVAVPTVSYRPVVALRPMPATYEVGRGLLGQPKLYVPKQPVRNFIRYISP
jgi:hypothetical protein